MLAQEFWSLFLLRVKSEVEIEIGNWKWVKLEVQCQDNLDACTTPCWLLSFSASADYYSCLLSPSYTGTVASIGLSQQKGPAGIQSHCFRDKWKCSLIDTVADTSYQVAKEFQSSPLTTAIHFASGISDTPISYKENEHMPVTWGLYLIPILSW